MKTAGIIAEYNPFHKGHQYQIEYTRKNLGADYIIIAMSGDYVQRGTPALLPKHVRAEMALKCGADLVLELPVSVSTASAEFFAEGGVQLLDSLHVVDMLCFGSESGSLSTLKNLAALLTEEPEEYRLFLKELLSQGKTFPAARGEAIIKYFQNTPGALSCSLEELESLLLFPNNILGIEYCKALRRLKSKISPCTLQRKGAGYHDTDVFQTENPSASAIRKLFLSSPDSFSRGKDIVPKETASLLENALKDNAFVTEADLSLLLFYRLLEEENTSAFLDVSRELSMRIKNSKNKYQNFSQFVSLLKTKEMTQTRIQRALLHILLHIKEVPSFVPFAKVLGFRKESAPLLREIKKRSSIPLITKASDASLLLNEEGETLLLETVFSSNLYGGILSSKTGTPFVHEFEKQIIIL